LNSDALPESLLFKKDVTPPVLLLLTPAFSLFRKLVTGALDAPAPEPGTNEVTVRDLTMLAEPAPPVPAAEVTGRLWDCSTGVATACLGLAGVFALLITLLKGLTAGLATSAMGLGL
jgi:hypothetical protein